MHSLRGQRGLYAQLGHICDSGACVLHKGYSCRCIKAFQHASTFMPTSIQVHLQPCTCTPTCYDRWLFCAAGPHQKARECQATSRARTSISTKGQRSFTSRAFPRSILCLRVQDAMLTRHASLVVRPNTASLRTGAGFSAQSLAGGRCVEPEWHVCMPYLMPFRLQPSEPDR